MSKMYGYKGPYNTGTETDLDTDNGYSVMNDLVSGINDMETSKIKTPFEGTDTHLFKWSVFTDQAMFDRIGGNNPDQAERYYQWTQVLNPTQTTNSSVSKMDNFSMANEQILTGDGATNPFGGLYKIDNTSTYLTASSLAGNWYWPVQFTGLGYHWSAQGNPTITELYIWVGPKPASLP